MPSVGKLINKYGNMQGWNNVTINLLGRDVEGISSIKYDDKVAKENVYGAGQYPIGRSQGNYEASCTINLYKEESDGIQAALPEGVGIHEIPPFDILVEYELSTGKIKRDRIRNCEFTGRGVEIKSGDGTSSFEHELICSHIEWNVV